MKLGSKLSLDGLLATPWLRAVEPYVRWALGRTGERKAVALLGLAFYATIFLLIGLVDPSAMGGVASGQPLDLIGGLASGGWGRCFLGLSACYGLAFFAVAAGYFWGRWFAAGLAASGALTAVLAMITAGYNPALVVWGLSHGMVWLMLGGEAMAALFDGQTAWRLRWQLDEEGVERVRKSVTRAAAGLPSLIAYALAPRTEQHCTGSICIETVSNLAHGRSLLALVALLLTTTGLVALLARRAAGAVLLLAAFVAIACGALSELVHLDHLRPLVPLANDGLSPLQFACGPLLQGAQPFQLVGGMAAALVATVCLWAAVRPFTASLWSAVKPPRTT